MLPRLLREKSFHAETSLQEVCPIIVLPDNFDAYLELLDKKEGKEVQRKLRRAKGAGDALSWYIVNGEHHLDSEVDKFLSLMASSHPEKAQFLQNEQHRTFFKSIVPAAAEAGWLQMNFLEVMGEPVAGYVNFDYNNQILVYNSGLAPNKAPALSPGIVLLAYNIEHAIQNRREVFDFLRGDEQYKYRMGGQETQIFNLKASLS
jgi:CelD/BcsL family acetyltransferase involved in cellulose biosynthesis